MIIQSTVLRAFETSMNIHQLTSQKFPSSEKFGIVYSRLNRSINSKDRGVFTVMGLESTRFIAFIKHFLCVFLNSRIRGVAFCNSYILQSRRPVVFVCSKPYPLLVDEIKTFCNSQYSPSLSLTLPQSISSSSWSWISQIYCLLWFSESLPVRWCYLKMTSYLAWGAVCLDKIRLQETV
jgi:hypothetical protein